ncbi:unnamed protein product [Candida verbasci]|uniref:BZIP domain-containing protein n=1 Tax=Candida verbasci TaxID=1227364 RepID=A0A9W4TXT8_9ASCO|nr:unnamed protein product [Candida verbasci]
MNFESDYLQNLNLDFDSLNNNVSPNLNQDQLQQDLDLFSKAANDFFDLDVLNNNEIKPIKPVIKEEEVEPQNNFYSPTAGYQFLHPSPPQEITQPNTGIKRSHSVISTPSSVNTPASNSTPLTAHFAAAEDKRKRNTAASARFRIKKKLKEQEMEKKSRDLEEKVSVLEKKLKTMEMENKCLKSIILQQNEQKNVDLLESIKKRSILDSNIQFEYTN